MPKAYSYKVIELQFQPILYNSKVCVFIHCANGIHLSGPLPVFFFQMGKLFHFMEGRTVDQKV